MIKSDPLISFIIPTYNRAIMLGQTLDSIIRQSYSNWECIVVDDGSEDYTEELMEFYCSKESRILYHKRPSGIVKGANSCRNHGFKISKGNLIQWFDSDDLIHPDCIKSKLTVLSSFDDLVLCDAGYYDLDFKHRIHTFVNNTSSEKILWDYLSGYININTPTVLWKREVVSDFSFDENLARAQELDFHFRILKNKNLKIKYVDKELVFIRAHQDSITGDHSKEHTKSINSVLKVNRQILDFAFKQSTSNKIKNRCLRRYLDSIRECYKYWSLPYLYRELNNFILLEKIPGFKAWFRQFLFLAMVYKVTLREYKLKKHLYSLKI